MVNRDRKVDYLLLLVLVFWPRLGDPCVCQSPTGVCVSFSRTGIGLYIYHLFVWSNLNLLHISQWITLPTQSSLVLYSLFANLLYSLILWLMASPMWPHSLHLLFCRVLSIFALILLVLIALFCAAILRDSVSLLKFPFIIIIYSLEFFTSALADGLSLKSEWYQVSSSLQDSSQYSGNLQQCCRLDSLYSAANF